MTSVDVDDRKLELTRVASVLIAITDSKSAPEIILTQRSESMPTHSGQVAFPGGRWEASDRNLAQTAIRESKEEIGLAPALVNLRGRLQERPSISGLMVYPFVASVPDELDLVPDPSETQAIFRVPLSFFVDTKPEIKDKVERDGIRFQVPAWYFQDYEIWGLTAFFLQDLVKRLNHDTD